MVNSSKKQKSHWFRKTLFWTWVIGVPVAVAVVTVRSENYHGHAERVATIVTMVLLYPWLAFMALGFIAGVVGLIINTAKSAKKANTPVPPPAQIAYRLQSEWGRPPTVQEVAAVQQMLMNEKNAAMVQAGIGIGALYAASRLAKGEKIL